MVRNSSKAREILSDLVGKFSRSTFPKAAAAAFLERAGTPSDTWSYGNRVIMLMHGTRDARGYRQWQAVGRHVVKGSKALYILAPITVTAAKRDDDDKDDGGQEHVVGFRGVPVFRVEDTDGEPVSYVKNAPPLPPLHDVAEKWGVCIKYDAPMRGESGSFNPDSNEIRLCDADAVTFFHELAHVAHRRVDGELKPGQDPEQEAVAELTACVLANMYGAGGHEGYAWNYIAAYAEGSKTPEGVGRMCFKVLGKTGRVLETILCTA